MLTYKNPIIFSDYSDPDVIRVGKYFYMVSSSFNFLPGVPVLRSENLVEWKHVNYVVKKLPFARFDKVCSGEGAWAPSVRSHGGKFYCLIPLPDEGIYVSETEDIEGEWSPLRPLIEGKGIIDPCPIWEGDKCYVACAFARSRAGFNSVIGLYKVSPDLTRRISDGFTVIYDGHADNPVIEGPKFYKRGEYFYILAPAGSVKSGWQTALRSKNIYGPYESKIILMQDDSPVNGPHQGALVDAPDGTDWFVHFQDMAVYGRIVHLQPVTWQDGWPVCGKIKYDGLAGSPVAEGQYPVQRATGDALCRKDGFSGGVSPMWQTPANFNGEWFSTGDGLTLKCVPCTQCFNLTPNLLTTKITCKNFRTECELELRLDEDGDEVGFGVYGKKSAYISILRQNGSNYIRFSVCEGGADEVIIQRPFESDSAAVRIVGENFLINRLKCSFYVNGRLIYGGFEATEGVWVGARYAIFARNICAKRGGGAIVKCFEELPVDPSNV